MAIKLHGLDYTRYWQRRFAKQGPRFAGHSRLKPRQLDAQGQLFWSWLEPHLPAAEGMTSVVEFGSGCGRMTRRLKDRYPEAAVCGVELVEDAAALARRLNPDIRFVVARHYPASVPTADLLLTCTCLQHITDAEIFQAVVSSFQQRVRPGGLLVLLENIEPAESRHMSGRPPEAYPQALRGFSFGAPQEHVVLGQRHVVLVGVHQ